MSEAFRNIARTIFAEALKAVDVGAAVQRHLRVTDDVLGTAGAALPLTNIDRILIVAIGKAAVPMYHAAAMILRDVPVSAVVVGPHETLPAPAEQAASPHIQYLPGDHPLVTERSLYAAGAVLHAAQQVNERTGVLFLISGGASAMVEQPLDPAISLEDLTSFTRGLVGSGLPITEMNIMRKHLSAVKGGRLAQGAAAARWQVSLLLSDVPHALPDVIGSGPSLPDSSTVAECFTTLLRLRRSCTVPASVDRWFAAATLPETPKPDHDAFRRSHWAVILSSEHLATAAARAAEACGFASLVDTTCDDWEYRDAGAYLLTRALELLVEKRAPVCLISVGEVSVQLNPEAGVGGRNQQLALWCALEADRQGLNVTILSAGSDGIDGNSFAAGAVCDETTPLRAATQGLCSALALQHFNTTPLLASIGDALMTGPTGNNLRDLRIFLLSPAET